MRGSAGWIRQSANDRALQLRKIVNHGTPDRLDIDAVVLMPKPVADAADVAPRKIRAQEFGLIAETDRGFADHLQLALDCGDGFGIGSESCLVHIACELLDGVDRLGNVP